MNASAFPDPKEVSYDLLLRCGQHADHQHDDLDPYEQPYIGAP